MSDGGTPKSLTEAIQFGMCIGPAKDTPENIRKRVKEFAAQRFGEAMLKWDHSGPSEAGEAMMELYSAIFGEPLK